MEYVDQSANALQFNLVKGVVNKSKLNVLCENTLSIPNTFTINMGIIGASHYLEVVKNNKSVFTEVLACIDINSIHKVVSSKASTVGRLSLTFDDLDYLFIKKLLTGAEAKQKIKDTELFGNTFNHIMLKYTFPTNQEKCTFKPTTFITATIVPKYNRVAVRTIHAYPNEDKVVSTLTLVTKI